MSTQFGFFTIFILTLSVNGIFAESTKNSNKTASPMLPVTIDDMNKTMNNITPTTEKFNLTGVLDTFGIHGDVTKTCDVDSHCKAPKTYCKNGTCVCMDRTILAADGKACLDILNNIGDKCMEDSQCSSLRKTYGKVVCINFICECEGIRTKKVGDMCIEDSKLGGYCEANESCPHANSHCIQGICSCDTGFIPHQDNKRCLSVLKEINSTCEMKEQCSAQMGDKTICLNHRCVCLNGYHFDGKTCTHDKNLGSICTVDIECLVSEGTEPEGRRGCFNHTCSCGKKFEAMKGENFCKPSLGNKITNFFVLNCSMLLILMWKKN